MHMYANLYINHIYIYIYIYFYPTLPNPTQPNPTQAYPTQPNPTLGGAWGSWPARGARRAMVVWRALALVADSLTRRRDFTENLLLLLMMIADY